AHVLESLGASISGFSGRNSIGLDVEFLSKHWPVIKPILGEVLTHPTFPAEELETERALVLRTIKAEKDSPANLCHLNFLGGMYPDHPYGRSSLGTEETVSSFTQESLRRFFENHVRSQGLVLASVGSFPSQEWEEELNELLSAIPKTGAAPTPDTE